MGNQCWLAGNDMASYAILAAVVLWLARDWLKRRAS